MPVYMLHYERGLLNGRNRHYVGYAAEDVERRIKQHRRGYGSAFAREMKRQGIAFRVARIWPDLGTDGEREIKRQKQADRYCPICHPGAPRLIPSERRTAEAIQNASKRPVAASTATKTAEASKGAPMPETASDFDPQWVITGDGPEIEDDGRGEIYIVGPGWFSTDPPVSRTCMYTDPFGYPAYFNHPADQVCPTCAS